MTKARPATKAKQYFVLLGMLLLLSACVGHQQERTDSTGEGLYRPPAGGVASPSTLVQPTASPINSQTTRMAPEVSPTPACTNRLRFIEDLTIPDGSQVEPGASLDKRWRVENSGSCNWDERYRVILSAGPVLGASDSSMLYPARSGTQATLQVIFTAPVEAGTYRSAWQAQDPSGEPFGDLFFIEVTVP